MIRESLGYAAALESQLSQLEEKGTLQSQILNKLLTNCNLKLLRTVYLGGGQGKKLSGWKKSNFTATKFLVGRDDFFR